MKFNKETLNYQKNVIYKNHSTSSNLNKHKDTLNQIDDNSIEKKAKLKFKEKNKDIQKNFETNVSKNIFTENNSFLLSIISELELKVKKLNQEILGLRSEFRK